MNIAVIGLGSMGKRRIRLLQQFFKVESIQGIDSREDRRTECEKLYNIKTCSTIDELEQKENIVLFVCTAPLTHSEIILSAIERKYSIFTEINLVADNYEKIIKKADDNGVTLFLSSTPLYRKEIEYITQSVQKTECHLNYIYHVGQYLPDWHPWESFSNFFVAQKRTNGCRELFAIELPWIINAFGEIKTIYALKNNISNLPIEYPDNFLVSIEHTNGHKGVLCFDIVSRNAVRKLEVFGEMLHLNWNGTPDSLFHFDLKNKLNNQINVYETIEKNAAYSSNIIENMYVDEMRNFFNVLNKKDTPRYSFEKDVNTLRIIDQIESIS